MEAVKNNGMALDEVPMKLRTPELCMAALENAGQALAYVPERLKTLEMCKKAVKNSGWALDDVPDTYKTPEICRIALETSLKLNGGDPEIISFIPYPEVCLDGLKLFKHSTADAFEIFSSLKPERMNDEIALYGVKMTPVYLIHIPERLKTKEVCLEQ